MSSLGRFSKRIVKFIIFIFSISLFIGLVLSFVFPIGYKDYINKYSSQYGIDPFLVAAIINIESKYNKDVVSYKYARGLMQIGPQTGEWGAKELNIEDYSHVLLFNPEINIRIGTWYLDQLNKEFNYDLNLVLAAYNAGSGNVQKWLANTEYSRDGVELSHIPFKETEEYVKKVNYNYYIYKNIYKHYMEKPDSINSLYINVIIIIKTYIKKFLQSL